MSQDGLLTADAVYAVLSEEKPNQNEQIKLPRDELRKYFPQNYSDEQIKRLGASETPTRTQQRRSLIRTKVYSEYLLQNGKNYTGKL